MCLLSFHLTCMQVFKTGPNIPIQKIKFLVPNLLKFYLQTLRSTLGLQIHLQPQNRNFHSYRIFCLKKNKNKIKYAKTPYLVLELEVQFYCSGLCHSNEAK